MENIGEQKESIGEQVSPIGETLPIIIEKKPRKKRETQSAAQLETLKKGREKLAEKRQKQRDTKKQAPVNDAINKLDIKYSQLLEQLESRIHTVPVPVNEPTPAPSPIKSRPPRIFV